MDDQRDVAAIGFEDVGHCFCGADVEVVMPVAADLAFQLQPVPAGAGVAAEKDAAHVIVDADDVNPLRGEAPDGVAADQTRRSRDNRHRHSYLTAFLFRHECRPMRNLDDRRYCSNSARVFHLISGHPLLCRP